MATPGYTIVSQQFRNSNRAYGSSNGIDLLAIEGDSPEALFTNDDKVVIDLRLFTSTLTVVGGAVPVTVFGGSGNLILVNGSSTGSVVVGGLGNATVSGGTGALTAFGGAGNSLLVGGSAGGNVLVGGTGFATLIGGGSGDLLFATNVAPGTRQILSASSGNETLSGAGTTQGNVYFAGNGAARTLVGAGTGDDTIFGGSGDATVDGGAGADLMVFANGRSGGTVLVNRFDTALGDRISLQGYAPGEVAAAVAAQSSAGAGATIVLSDNTRVTFAGVSHLDTSAFV